MKHAPYDDVFLKKYSALNAAQKKAVDSIDGPVMVIAGPGTGKTTILTLRIANILKMTDTPPSGILAITYTDAGVKAMRAKLRETIGNRAHEIAIHTFHSFAAAMIAEYPDHFLHLEGLRNLTDIEEESIIRGIIEAAEFRTLRRPARPDAYVSAVMSAIDESKREAHTPEMVRQFARDEIERIKNSDESKSTRGPTKGKLLAVAEDEIGKCERTALFADVYERYEEKKTELKRVDFNDLLISLLDGFRRDELLLRLVQERFLYLLVDEHQDTNDTQNLIIRAIASFFDTPNVFIVGDEKQAIYRFQGASVENFLSLRQQWPSMILIPLDINYRSHQMLLDASFSMIERNYEEGEHSDLRVRLSAGGDEAPRPIDLIDAGNVAAAEGYLVSMVNEIIGLDPKATIAIITRRNRDVERLIRVLESAHVPVSSERSVDIFHHPVGSLFFDLLEFLADPARMDCLAKTIAAGMWSVGFGDSIHLIKGLRSGNAIDLKKDLPALVRLRADMAKDGAVAFLVHAAALSGYNGIIARDPAAIHVWRGIVALAESLARDGNITDPLVLIKNMLAYRLSAESKAVKVSVGAPDLPVRAMTAHGSKGLEFDYVFIPYATEESWIGRKRGASFVLPKRSVGDTEKDVRRLFYVALTRVRRHAVVIVPLQESDGKELSPLRFVTELDPASVSHTAIPRVQAEPSKTVEAKKASPLIDFAKRMLIENGLSVTALNHFLECPNKFLYLSILKLPQAPSPAAEKGTAMHYAISSIWKEGDRTAARIKDAIIEKAAEYLDTSLLAASEKESVKRDLFEDAPAFAKALESHFNAGPRAAIFTERWAQREPLDKSQVPLHGKLDAIIDTGEELRVFDYKTREGMSVNEIKGETKNSNGDYFRQLVFYRILLADDPHWKGRKITPALVFVSPDKKGRCPIVSLPISEGDIIEVKKQIQSVIDAVWSGDLLSKKCDDHDCEWCSLTRMSFS